MNNKIHWIAKISIVAALYVVLTLISYPFSFNYIQVRIAEALMILVCYDKKYSIALIIGCFISNIFSIISLDILFGTLATIISCIIMMFMKNRIIASIIPVIINALIVGLEFYITTDITFLLCALYVGIGELISCFIIGNITFYFIDKRPLIVEKIKQ